MKTTFISYKLQLKNTAYALLLLAAAVALYQLDHTRAPPLSNARATMNT